MASDRWEEINRLYYAALEVEEKERTAFLDGACGTDGELRREVECLLATHAQADGFLEKPAVEERVKSLKAEHPSLVGRKLGHYQVLGVLGAGGMGEVYRAKDSRLDRSVAIKVLTSEKVADPERKRRFVQEAKAASALNHPNIITIYEINSEDGVDFIAMEYVAGKTLDQLIPRKGMRLNDALRLAIQMADALAKAHSAGIIHRDLKPSNVMVTHEAQVKLLDFGVAKLSEVTESSERTTRTMLSQTEEGTIVGTLCYMSPEQAEGKKIDARSDIFSFGSVLYEIVTGRKAFQGETKLSTLTAILREEPKRASELVEGLPKELERIIQRCLRKEPSRRFQYMADVKVELEELKEESDSGKLVPAGVAPRSRRWRPIWSIAALALLAAAGVAIWFSRSNSEAPEEPMTVLPLTSYPGFERHASFSPDGNHVAFAWNGEKPDNSDIYVKLIGGGPPLPLTSDPAEDFSPAWSPDGRFIAFLREQSTEKLAVFLVPALGGAERKLGETWNGGWIRWSDSYLAWSPDGKFLVISDKASSNEPAGLFSLTVETGGKQRLTLPPAKWISDGDPAFSPDGHTLAFSRSSGDLYLLDLSAGGVPIGEPKRLTFDNRGYFGPAWTADGRDIIFASGALGSRALWRMPAFGSGKPQRLPSIGEVGSHSQPAISRQGHRLAYTEAILDGNIRRVGVGPQGKVSPPTSFISSTRLDSCPQFSPNGKRIAFSSARSSRPGSYEIWVCNSDGSGAQQLTSLGAEAGFPRWSPDGERIAFDSNAERQFDIYVISANGEKPQRLTSDPSTDALPSWSSDGKWIYFRSDRTGESQVWKMPSGGGEAARVTQKGGAMALESPDGKSVYYMKTEGPSSLWKVPVGGGEETEVLASVAGRSFAVVDKGIYFISLPSSSSDHLIQFLNLANGKINRVAATRESPPYGLTVSPDEQSFLYSEFDSSGSDLMLVENFK
jgi:Tol biopolymer transport system component/predicted Ser/Thr protein kinase